MLRMLEQAPPGSARVEPLEAVTIEHETRTAGAERVRQLLGEPGPAPRPLRTTAFRSFEVRHVVPGRGLWVSERLPRGGRGEPFWVDDPGSALAR